ncbi:MAG: hypothetical protein QM627_12385 [Luteolibacter sp.]
MKRFFRLFPILLLVLLCQCGAPNAPTCARVPMASRAPSDSLLTTARQSWEILEDSSRKDEWPGARARYNDAVAKLFDQLRCGQKDWNAQAARLGTRIASPDDPREVKLEALDVLFPAGQVNVKSLSQRHLSEGIGVPVVGWKETSALGKPRKPYFLPSGLPYNVTVTLSFGKSGPPVWNFTKRWLHNDLQVGPLRHPLAADWTAANAFYWHMCDLDDLTIQNVMLPERYINETGLYFLQPYDPKKIPVVMVHGLKSSPDAFKFIINDLAPEPWFRENYQIWLFNYPTGTPWLYNGMKFREMMRSALAYARSKGGGEKLNQMVILSHSMGGLITRSSITDPGTKIYDAHFEALFSNLKVQPKTRELIRESMLYKPLTEPKRVVFMAVPHQGSPMANFRPSLILGNLIRLPKILTVEMVDAVVHSGSGDPEDTKKVSLPTSITSLSPKSRGIIGLNKLPLPKGIVFHSIIGDRGKGGDLWKSSDGVVPYWSSHIGPVASEKIVPYPHGVTDFPETSVELKRILKLHLRELKISR